MRRFWQEVRPALSTATLIGCIWGVCTGGSMLIALLWYAAVVFLTSRAVHDIDGGTLLRRYYLFRTPWLRVFLHQMHSHDTGRYPHSHPWQWAKAVILCGGYLEYRLGFQAGRVLSGSGAGSYRWYARGDVNHLHENTYHRIEDIREGTWTLFVAGSRNKDWGFMTPSGHVNAERP